MVQGSKTQKIVLDSQGSYLGMEKGCFTVKDREGNVQRFPLFENTLGSVVLKSGNAVSTGALASLGFWDIDVLIMTQRGNPVAMLRSLDDSSHVETRIAQYESLKNVKFSEIAKQFVLSKIEAQNQVLSKYGLRRLDYSHIEQVKGLKETDSRTLRNRLTTIESHCSRLYFDQIFQMFNEPLRPDGRNGFKAYDGINNLFNLAYEVLSWKVHIALVRARLEPFMGYLHSLAWSKPSLVCDFQELYRYLMDDYVIQYARGLKAKDFTLKTEDFSSKKKGKREYLSDFKTRDFMKSLNEYFLSEVKIPRYRMGKKQELETLISEEAMLFAKYLRNERQTWIPRIPSLA
ncbi:MAG: CRISPR-associated endonuclease Cas1 [Candidatus Bathyarchaeia archaeon]